MSDDLKKGLEGVLAAESGLSTIDGDAGSPLHGGANQDVMRMLEEVDDSDKDPVA